MKNGFYFHKKWKKEKYNHVLTFHRTSLSKMELIKWASFLRLPYICLMEDTITIKNKKVFDSFLQLTETKFFSTFSWTVISAGLEIKNIQDQIELEVLQTPLHKIHVLNKTEVDFSIENSYFSMIHLNAFKKLLQSNGRILNDFFICLPFFCATKGNDTSEKFLLQCPKKKPIMTQQRCGCQPKIG